MILLPLAERRAMADAAVRANPERSDRRLAKETGLTQELISHRRSLLVETGEITNVAEVVGLNGKTIRCRRLSRKHYGLAARIALIRRIARDLDDHRWEAATPEMQRLLWQSAEQLAEKAGAKLGKLGLMV